MDTQSPKSHCLTTRAGIVGINIGGRLTKAGRRGAATRRGQRSPMRGTPSKDDAWMRVIFRQQESRERGARERRVTPGTRESEQGLSQSEKSKKRSQPIRRHMGGQSGDRKVVLSGVFVEIKPIPKRSRRFVSNPSEFYVPCM